MNDALAYYQGKKEVWHINGYSPINNLDKKTKYFYPALCIAGAGQLGPTDG